MFEAMKAKFLTALASKTDLLLLPNDWKSREIAEAMFIEGAPVTEINQSSLNLYLEQLKQKRPAFLLEWQPVADFSEGPLKPRTRRSR